MHESQRFIESDVKHEDPSFTKMTFKKTTIDHRESIERLHRPRPNRFCECCAPKYGITDHKHHTQSKKSINNKSSAKKISIEGSKKLDQTISLMDLSI
jgi:hypothetical protein